jgi:hypothetical protein
MKFPFLSNNYLCSGAKLADTMVYGYKLSRLDLVSHGK